VTSKTKPVDQDAARYRDMAQQQGAVPSADDFPKPIIDAVERLFDIQVHGVLVGGIVDRYESTDVSREIVAGQETLALMHRDGDIVAGAFRVRRGQVPR
jgi:hypothetical protein